MSTCQEADIKQPQSPQTININISDTVPLTLYRELEHKFISLRSSYGQLKADIKQLRVKLEVAEKKAGQA